MQFLSKCALNCGYWILLWISLSLVWPVLHCTVCWEDGDKKMQLLPKWLCADLFPEHVHVFQSLESYALGKESWSLYEHLLVLLDWELTKVNICIWWDEHTSRKSSWSLYEHLLVLLDWEQTKVNICIWWDEHTSRKWILVWPVVKGRTSCWDEPRESLLKMENHWCLSEKMLAGLEQAKKPLWFIILSLSL